MVWEQNAVVPGKSLFAGLMRYIRRSGLQYVLPQMAKQTVCNMLRIWVVLTGRKHSMYYPYWLPRHKRLLREIYGRISSNEAYNRVRCFAPDVVLSLFSKEIIPDRILHVPAYGAVNLHPSPLPLFRGVSPIFWAMAQGQKECGISLHELDAGIDTGRIISQKKLPMHPGESEHTVYLRLASEGVQLVVAYLRTVQQGKRPEKLKKNITKNSAYYSLPTKEAVRRLYQNGYTMVRFSELFHRI